MGSGSDWNLFFSKFFKVTEGSFEIFVTKEGKVIGSENYKLSPATTQQ